MIKIWFEPHATSLDNEAGRASGWNDVDLSELGLTQAEQLVERCRPRGLHTIFTSDLQRAVKTAVPTADKLRLPIFPDRNLRECDYGDMTLEPKAIIDSERVRRISEPFPNGESYQECMTRMARFINRLRVDFDNKRVLVIGHRATHYGLDHIIKNKSLEVCVSEKFEWQPGWEYELK